MKPSNLVVSGSQARPPGLTLVDTDDVRFAVRLSRARRRRSLRQFLSGLPGSPTRHERARFFLDYARETGLSRAELRRVLE
jgi:hypothetical protein